MYTASILALTLAFSICILVTLLLFPVTSIDTKTLILVDLFVFFSSFILTFIVLKYILFSTIHDAYRKILLLLGKPDARIIKKRTVLISKILEDIHEAAASFAISKQAELNKLKNLEAFRAEFVANVSHELKTPIFTAQGFVHTLLDGAVNDKNVRNKFLKKAAQSLDSLSELVRDLLVLSQIETGDIKMKFNHIDLYALCGEVAEQFEQKNVKQHITVQPPKLGSFITVWADYLRITQVMNNLISNAIKYTDEEATITVRFTVTDTFVTTHVTDTGEGIPEYHLDRIFERFYRVEKSRSREKGGTGLGLSIVKHILERHHTQIEVKSIYGEGSTFSFTLPVAQPTQQ